MPRRPLFLAKRSIVVKVQTSIHPPGGILIYDEPRTFFYQSYGFENGELYQELNKLGLSKAYVWARIEDGRITLDFDAALPDQDQEW